MDTLTLLGLLLAVVFFAAAWQAWRIGNERRDVALLGVGGGVSAAGAALSFML
ncbi:hypothetical protein ACG04Q_00070 [Roseateles sp. DXS20W]|uniref:Uncharacterized protein n=1 Tax=Pelomonas lactea TaxID=3299030 RepID=A0ABW7GDN2_9BURK